MRDEDEQRFKETLVNLGITSGVEFDTAVIKAWWSLFKGYGIDQFEAAVRSFILDPDAGMYKPVPAHIMKFITGTSKQQEAAAKDKAIVAWACVEGAISTIGPYQQLKLKDKQALAVVKSMGGWSKLCEVTYDQLQWRQKEFIDIYQTFERSDVRALPNELPGLVQLHEKQEEENKGLQSLLSGLDIPKKTQDLF